MPKPNTRMTAMRQRALEVFAEGLPDDLTDFSTTALWEVARVQLKRGDPYSLAVVLVELHRRCPPVEGGRPISLAYHVSDTPAPVPASVSETARDTMPVVSDTPPLALEPSAPPPKAKDYPDWLKARAVAMHRSGESRETIRAMLIEQFGRAPDITNWSKTVRRWEASNPTTPGS
ncbi:hypothetical protein [Allochromatium vinosum]|uniref:hypothetical protein n=1 Tax=Allochromatium vinosum TaxID=1049 RepID=UPI001907AD81|nr:hypothetical protein [Allochromatium vinosum]MBK1655358.1 hypothetical protein [Allochromatium vinosum]